MIGLEMAQIEDCATMHAGDLTVRSAKQTAACIGPDTTRKAKICVSVLYTSRKQAAIDSTIRGARNSAKD